MSTVEMNVTTKDLANVRAALRFLRSLCGTWATLAKALHFGKSSIANVAGGHKAVTPIIAFRIARFAKVGVDDGVLGGRFPEAGTCPMCGHRPSDS